MPTEGSINMPDRAHIGLDNPAFRGRLRQPVLGRAQSFRVPVARGARPRGQYFSDVSSPTPPSTHLKTAQAEQVPANVTPPVQLVSPQPYAEPAQPKLQPTAVLSRQAVTPPQVDRREPAHGKWSRTQLALLSMAAVVFLVGIFVSIITLQTNHSAKAQVAALSKKAANSTSSSSVPNESKPSSGSVAAYQVAPDLPKYLVIPKLGVDARVRPLGVTSSNELQAPTNIYDTGWYNASAKPGDPGSNGAILIDGHVHGPTLPGVFVGIKTLQPGDTIQIVRGDNAVFTYIVKKVQNYDATTLNIGLGLGSIQPGEPGLNLMTCGGPFDRTSGEYTQRTIVFAVQKS